MSTLYLFSYDLQAEHKNLITVVNFFILVQFVRCFTWRMATRKHIVHGIIGLSAICVYTWPSSLSLIVFVLLITLVAILGVISALWINVLLSSPHKTIVGAEHELKQAENFRNRLMVRNMQ